MNAVTIVIGSICILMIAYRLYGTFMAVKVLKLNDAQKRRHMSLKMEKITCQPIDG